MCMSCRCQVVIQLHKADPLDHLHCLLAHLALKTRKASGEVKVNASCEPVIVYNH